MNCSSCLSYRQQVSTYYFHRRTSEQIQREFLIALLQIHRHQRIKDSRNLVTWRWRETVFLWCVTSYWVDSCFSSSRKLNQAASSSPLASLQYLSDMHMVGCEMVFCQMRLNVQSSIVFGSSTAKVSSLNNMQSPAFGASNPSIPPFSPVLGPKTTAGKRKNCAPNKNLKRLKKKSFRCKPKKASKNWEKKGRRWICCWTYW